MPTKKRGNVLIVGLFLIALFLFILSLSPEIQNGLGALARLKIKQTTLANTLITGSYVVLDLYPEHAQLLTNSKWIEQLDQAYLAYKDLMGREPYPGQKITIKEYSASDMHGALMYAGNPIHWSEPFVADMLNKINNNDLSFGPIHELGHDFDITPYSFYYIGSGNTPINAEQWANFKLTYVADTLASKYPDATFYQDAVGNVPIGQFSKKYFEDFFAQEWLNSSKGDWTTMKADAYTGLLYSLAHKYGWEIFKQTFRSYSTIGDSIPTDNLQKVNLFVKLLSEKAGADLKPTFISWGIPVSDYVPIGKATRSSPRPTSTPKPMSPSPFPTPSPRVRYYLTPSPVSNSQGSGGPLQDSLASPVPMSSPLSSSKPSPWTHFPSSGSDSESSDSTTGTPEAKGDSGFFNVVGSAIKSFLQFLVFWK